MEMSKKANHQHLGINDIEQIEMLCFRDLSNNGLISEVQSFCLS
ncbi:hypothetical protein SLEP1_g57005 [Rubroshorea leprosula]|uniref:Uncharacterized protein n=1 Tax=Rubroshorea leprosula TaxID=152421 RepID=A0AAV5MPE7_9ROSI|nr:hypothetical protein SLEP1_g57005 [Rubroshorea leprosula]